MLRADQWLENHPEAGAAQREAIKAHAGGLLYRHRGLEAGRACAGHRGGDAGRGRWHAAAEVEEVMAARAQDGPAAGSYGVGDARHPELPSRRGSHRRTRKQAHRSGIPIHRRSGSAREYARRTRHLRCSATPCAPTGTPALDQQWRSRWYATVGSARAERALRRAMRRRQHRVWPARVTCALRLHARRDCPKQRAELAE